jgi:uncharacterized protein YjbI with pentapeptide repeats
VPTRPGPPGREHPFFRNLAERRQRRAQRPAPAPAADGDRQAPARPRTFHRTAAHYWHHQRKAAREAGNRYPSFVQVPGPWRVAKLGAAARARQRGRPRDRTLVRAWFEWLFTRPKVLLTRSGSARLAVEVFSVVVVLGTLWGFWVERERREEERQDRRADRINAAWTLIAAAKQEQTGNLGLGDAIGTLRGYGIDDFTGLFLPGAHLNRVQLGQATLIGAMLRESWLEGATLAGAIAFGSDFSKARLRSADLLDAYLLSAHFSGADLQDADASGAVLSAADLTGAELGGANFSGADLSMARLSSARLGRMDFLRFGQAEPRLMPRIGLRNSATVPDRHIAAKFASAILTDARLDGAEAQYADFSDALLRGANLSGTQLSGASLGGADCTDADFSFADMLYVKGLDFAELGGARSAPRP